MTGMSIEGTLFDDHLSEAISDFVINLLPGDEDVQLRPVEVFTLGMFPRPSVTGDAIDMVVDVDRYWIATLTNKFFRIHHLDYWWQLSDEGFEYIERTNREGRYRRIRNYDSLIDVYGKRMCYLPNEVDRLELSISELLAQRPVWHKASRKIAFHLYDNYMIRTTGFVSMTLDSPQYSTEINSVFKSIVQINQILGNQKT